jgi:hypothetical protein
MPYTCGGLEYVVLQHTLLGVKSTRSPRRVLMILRASFRACAPIASEPVLTLLTEPKRHPFIL